MSQSSVVIKSYGKINLLLNVMERLPDGYHRVDMVLQQVTLHDLVSVGLNENTSEIRLTTNHPQLPLDAGNLAFQAAARMKEATGYGGGVDIYLEKRIPLASGLAGGSGNGAAVLLAMDHLLGSRQDYDFLLKLAEELGSDVPFSMGGQVACHPFLKRQFLQDERPCTCAQATGTGTCLRPLEGLDCWVVLVTPDVESSTKDIYQAWDQELEKSSPLSYKLIEGLVEKNWQKIGENMGNDLEIVAGKKYPIIVYTKNRMEGLAGEGFVQMSGSGPTIFGIFQQKKKAEKVALEMKKMFSQVALTHTSPLKGSDTPENVEEE